MMSATPNRHDRRTGRVSAALRGLWLAVVVTVGLPALVSAFAQPPAFGRERDDAREATTASERDVKFAEAAATASRLRMRFRETLDFAPLMDEFFVADVGRRNQSAAGFGGYLAEFGAKPELLKTLGESELRRGYTAFLNFIFLHEAYVLSTAQLDADADDDEFPPLAMREMLASTYYRAALEEDVTAMPELATHDDYMRLVADTEAIATSYRRLVTPQTFDDPTYVENRARLDRKEQILATRSDADSGYVDFGVPEGETVYEVSRFGMWYAFVEENGTLRLLTIAVGED